MKKTKTIPVNIPQKFTIGHVGPEASWQLFDFLRHTCGHDFDFKTKEQGYCDFETTFQYKGPFQPKKD
jgi:hypothetical protein